MRINGTLSYVTYLFPNVTVFPKLTLVFYSSCSQNPSHFFIQHSRSYGRWQILLFAGPFCATLSVGSEPRSWPLSALSMLFWEALAINTDSWPTGWEVRGGWQHSRKLAITRSGVKISANWQTFRLPCHDCQYPHLIGPEMASSSLLIDKAISSLNVSLKVLEAESVIELIPTPSCIDRHN